jgi:hypothetical protein
MLIVNKFFKVAQVKQAARFTVTGRLCNITIRNNNAKIKEIFSYRLHNELRRCCAYSEWLTVQYPRLVDLKRAITRSDQARMWSEQNSGVCDYPSRRLVSTSATGCSAVDRYRGGHHADSGRPVSLLWMWHGRQRSANEVLWEQATRDLIVADGKSIWPLH